MKPKKLIFALAICACVSRKESKSKSADTIPPIPNNPVDKPKNKNFMDPKSAELDELVTVDTKATFDRMDSQTSPEDVCRDWKIAIHVINMVQAPMGRSGTHWPAEKAKSLHENCPTKFSEMAVKLYQLQQELKDFHTAALHRFIPRIQLSAITKCETGPVCNDVVEAAVVPIDLGFPLSPFFISYPSPESPPNLYRVLKVNNRELAFIHNEAIQSNFSSRIAGSTAGTLGRFLFTTNVFDPPDRSSQTVLVKNVRSGEIGRVVTAKGLIPNKQGGFRQQEDRMNLTVNRNYGCETLLESPEDEVFTDKNLGSCITKDNRLVSWIGSFSSEGIINHLKSAIKKNPRITEKPIIIDVRNNGGGSPFVAGLLSCIVGDEESLEIMKRRDLEPPKFPARFFDGSEGANATSIDLGEDGNNDLLERDDQWVVDIRSSPQPRRFYRKGFVSRFGDENFEGQCRDLMTLGYKKAKWVVMTNGQEFSATENFLSFVAPLDRKVKIIGQKSKGGTGAPMFFTLPSTGYELRLSLARHVDKVTGEFHIEGVGVSSDIHTDTEVPSEFEKNSLHILDNGMDLEGTHFSLIFKKALAVTF